MPTRLRPDDRSRGWLPLVSLLLFSASAPTASPSAETLPEAARVESLAELLPARPRAVGRPVDDRRAWDALRSISGFADLCSRASREMERPLPEMTDEVFLDFSRTGNRDRGQRVINERHGRFPLLVLAECLESQGRFLPAIERAIRSVCGEKTWVLPAHDAGLENYRGQTVEIDLNSAATSWDLALALAWLGDRLSDDLRALADRELERRTFTPYEQSIRTGSPRLWWVTGTNNWNAVCHAGVVGAALARIESPQRRAFFVAAAEKNVEHFLRGFTPDGYCSEGLGYWNYGFGHYVLLAETIVRATDGKVDLLARPEVARIACFGSRMEILPDVYPAFADCSLSSRPDARLLAYLDTRLELGLPSIDPDALRRPTSSLFTLGVYALEPKVAVAAPPGGAPRVGTLRDWFPDAGVLICRPAPGAPRALGVALKGGHNAEHHNHNDVGTFVVALGGGTPLVDPGAEVYTARTFSSRRYESRLLNSFGHPVPRIARRLQKTGAGARARVLETSFTEGEDRIRLDVRSAYDVTGLERLERTFAYSRDGRASLVVEDIVELAEPTELETALITLSSWRQEGASGLVVGSGESTVTVRVDTGGLAFEVTSETIDEDSRTRRKPTRIAIRLREPVDKARLRLEIVPAEAAK